MKQLIIFLFLLSAWVNICNAQDTALSLSTNMFDKTKEQIFLGSRDGWVFKQGNDTAWAKKDWDTKGWRKLKPTELSAGLADKNGRAEGWFRIKINLDSSFVNKPIGFNIKSWSAIDLYVDGKLLSSLGNTGINGKPFKEKKYLPYEAPVPVNLTSGNDHIIALHFVDYVAPLPPRRLKTEDFELGYFITLTSPNYNSFVINDIRPLSKYTIICDSICVILSILFWLLYFLNRNEKNIRLVALLTTCLAVTNFCDAQIDAADISYSVYSVYNNVDILVSIIFFIMIPVLLVHIFKRYFSDFLKLLLAIIFIAICGYYYVPSSVVLILFSFSFVALTAVCLYYVISSWRKLKGAQWAIVGGLLSSLFFLLVLLFLGFLYTSKVSYSIIGPVFSAFILSFPLSLLIYVALRFKEILNEVQQNARQVVQLSEEKKEHALIQQKILQEEVNRQTAEIRTALDNLKSTQSQLIQQEKMASLGELTAGIAHEIQNPLNFVNNFSDVNKELLAEMKDEMNKGNIDDAKEIANDVISNEEKINHHGKRADAIVKGMLQHSRSSTGVKEPTDINALADEYLRLAFHGLRAKDKNFNVELKTDFDNSIGRINIIPQDIGRVLLNLYNNAFYAGTEKKKSTDELYEPTVSVSTKKIGDKVEIRVKDNGNGIPQKVVDKIFQPFFTTKPTGQGTGLGLSLSYDIVKAHGGEIKVNTKEGQGTEFIVQIPLL